MVAQVVVAPVMAVGQVAGAVAKTSMTIAMKTGAAAMKAGVTAAKTVGTAVKTGVTRGVASAAKAGKGMMSSIRSGPLASRFSALTNARASVARAAPRSAMRAPSMNRSPIGEMLQRRAARSEARERMQMPRQYHPRDDRDRMVIIIVEAAQRKREARNRSMLMSAAKYAHSRAARMLSAPMRAGQAVQQQMKEHEARTNPSLER